jgi:23S rRNA pseudouridine1911/1915/1917 synthase
VHFRHIGFPIFGDLTYGKRQTDRLIEQTGFTPDRLLLHSWKLAFKHPKTGKRVAVEAPIPADFQAAIIALTP